MVAVGLGHVAPVFKTNNVDLALYFNGASYFVSAVTVYFLRQIGKRSAGGAISVPSTAKAIWEGWRFIRNTPVVRGLVIGMLGAFSAAGVVIGIGYPYIKLHLNGGSPGGALSSRRSSSAWRSAWGLAPGRSATCPGGGCSASR